MSKVHLTLCSSCILGVVLIILVIIATILGIPAPCSHEGTTPEKTEIVNLIAHTKHPVLRGGLVNLDTGHGEAQHTSGAILSLESHIVLECHIYTQQWRECLVDADGRDIEHRTW